MTNLTLLAVWHRGIDWDSAMETVSVRKSYFSKQNHLFVLFSWKWKKVYKEYFCRKWSICQSYTRMSYNRTMHCSDPIWPEPATKLPSRCPDRVSCCAWCSVAGQRWTGALRITHTDTHIQRKKGNKERVTVETEQQRARIQRDLTGPRQECASR